MHKMIGMSCGPKATSGKGIQERLISLTAPQTIFRAVFDDPWMLEDLREGNTVLRFMFQELR
jgi:hypothetical protein